MTEKNLEEKTSNELKHFILDWHQFIIDYWWRKKYNIPFGSESHRKMNFIDMAIEFTENEVVDEIRRDSERLFQEREDAELGISANPDEIKVSEEQIDEDYKTLDLSQFDK